MTRDWKRSGEPVLDQALRDHVHDMNDPIMSGQKTTTSTGGGKVTAVGEILVEMMSIETGEGFLDAQTFAGPYPSGAPAIFIDQMARIGVAASMVGAVGNDDFGRVNTNRLQADGVDISAVSISSEQPTGIAFVRYRDDGERDFLFTLSGSAAHQIQADRMPDHLIDTDHLHVVGSSLTLPSVAAYVMKAMPVIKARGGTVSFDPNVRREIMQDPRLSKQMDIVLAHSDIVLPSEGELPCICAADNDTSAIAELLDRGIKEVVMKRGRYGASRHSRDDAIEHRGFVVEEVDPTGAGDCFGATYVGCRRLGHTPEEALEYACAAGALAVLRRGPMEGASTLATIEQFIAQARMR